jgi:EAL domain-containing protein (putative c-di-GMP-specific phosphodiesterase class I)
MISMSKALDLDVTGEGIETADHVALLQGLDCSTGQGFFFAKPLPAAGIARMLTGDLSVSIRSREEGEEAQQELIEGLLRIA